MYISKFKRYNYKVCRKSFPSLSASISKSLSARVAGGRGSSARGNEAAVRAEAFQEADGVPLPRSPGRP